MLYFLFTYLDKKYHVPGFGLFQYITFRAGLAAVTALVIAFWLGPKIIRLLREHQIGGGKICLAVQHLQYEDAVLALAHAERHDQRAVGQLFGAGRADHYAAIGQAHVRHRSGNFGRVQQTCGAFVEHLAGNGLARAQAHLANVW